jgi:hypothetical protein
LEKQGGRLLDLLGSQLKFLRRINIIAASIDNEL